MPLTVEKAKPLSSLSTFGIGGPARYFAIVHSADEMREALAYTKQQNLKYMVIGKGSNCLFDDRGFDGLVILNKIEGMEEISPGIFQVGAGYSFSLLGTQTARAQWEGLEFAAGIPGTVGGAVYMNAGACGRETCQSLQSVLHMNGEGELRTYAIDELDFSYRRSPFQQMSGAIIQATFQLVQAPEARQKQREQIRYRTETQPYGEKSAGCMFRNPPGQSAGALIEQSELKGLQHGGAGVSEKHANFIINRGDAKATDVLSLIEAVKDRVYEQTGTALETEVYYIPYGGKE